MNSNASALIIPPATSGSATNDIRGLKPPVALPNSWAWIGWTFTLLLAVALAAWAWRKWRRKAAPLQRVPTIPAHVRARQRLQHALTLLSDPRAFCTLVSDAIRVYLEERFEFHAPERTTEEFLLELQSSPLLSLDQKQSLEQFLQSCDLVKFARFEPTEIALRELHDSASRLVDQTQFETIASPATPPPTPLQTNPAAAEPHPGPEAPAS